MEPIPVTVSCTTEIGEFEGWRHTIGHGGINRFPLPPRVQRGLAACKPRLVRTFIQEYFNVLPQPDRYDWSLLDPYMDSLAASGAKVVACICIKPPLLFPTVDQRVIMPNDPESWQRLISAMVTRYSVEKGIVTYWEIGNETDIGENGGCPYLTETPDVYNAYYKLTQEAVLRASSDVKVGGLALADGNSPLLEGLLSFCATERCRLDFVSWHLYADDPRQHAGLIRKNTALMKKYYPADALPEILITEFSKGFDKLCVAETAWEGFRAAAVGAAIFDMLDTETKHWSFYYHIWDQVFIAEDFKRFYKDLDIMLTHWNCVPHRLGLFGVCGEVRPTYFLYRLLTMMEGTALATETDCINIAQHALRVKAAKTKEAVSVMMINYDTQTPSDWVAEVRIADITDGLKRLIVYRIADDKCWDEETLTLQPVECRYVDIQKQAARRAFYCHVACPAYSVTLLRLEDVTMAQMAAAFATMK